MTVTPVFCFPLFYDFPRLVYLCSNLPQFLVPWTYDVHKALPSRFSGLRFVTFISVFLCHSNFENFHWKSLCDNTGTRLTRYIRGMLFNRWLQLKKFKWYVKKFNLHTYHHSNELRFLWILRSVFKWDNFFLKNFCVILTHPPLSTWTRILADSAVDGAHV